MKMIILSAAALQNPKILAKLFKNGWSKNSFQGPNMASNQKIANQGLTSFFNVNECIWCIFSIRGHFDPLYIVCKSLKIQISIEEQRSCEQKYDQKLAKTM